jgi:3-dehydro-L-gulonate 2-dehydrogenase
MKIDYRTLHGHFSAILRKDGFAPPRDQVISSVFADNTFDGVFSHGINRFPRFIRDVRSGTIDPGASPTLINRSGSLEQWDGQQGPGMLNALHCTERSIEVAKESGIGCISLRNTNHWMRGGTYGWKAAESGLMFIGWTNTIPNMPPWPGSTPALGNNPFIMAIPRTNGHIVLDMAMSQYSYGKLEWYQRKGMQLPEYGGYNRENKLSKDPSEILDSERILPIGLWKGSAFSLVLDLTAAILAGGSTSRVIGSRETETDLSQVFIALDIERFMDATTRDQLIEETLRFNSMTNPEARYPGERTLKDRELHRKEGIEVPEEVWEEISRL